MVPVTIAIIAFVLMEPIAAASHRWVMHGIGWALHRSHHDELARRFESNDVFPVMIAAIVCSAFAAGFNVGGWAPAIPVGVGVTLYGVAYALVHDIYIHHRVRWLRLERIRMLEGLAVAHRLHHLSSAAPYGMLLPLVPKRLRKRVVAVPSS